LGILEFHRQAASGGLKKTHEVLKEREEKQVICFLEVRKLHFFRG
jgi:hypothetical protein